MDRLLIPGNPSIVDDHINPPIPLSSDGQRCLPGLPTSNIAILKLEIGISVGFCFSFFTIQIQQDDSTSLTAESVRNRGAEAIGASGHDDNARRHDAVIFARVNQVFLWIETKRVNLQGRGFFYVLRASWSGPRGPAFR